jgi:hypothetical protein
VPFLLETLAGGKSFLLSSEADGILELVSFPSVFSKWLLLFQIKYEGISKEA